MDSLCAEATVVVGEVFTVATGEDIEVVILGGVVLTAGGGG